MVSEQESGDDIGAWIECLQCILTKLLVNNVIIVKQETVGCYRQTSERVPEMSGRGVDIWNIFDERGSEQEKKRMGFEINLTEEIHDTRQIITKEIKSCCLVKHQV